MCGIAGVAWADPQRPVERSQLERMCRALEHRGPDDRGIWIDGGVGLGHQRLSVIDLSEAGRQPMANEDGSVQVVFNGEIYGFPALREDLLRKGHEFRSRADSEVLVHLYEEYGDELVHRVDGMFAFAIWDGRRRRLLMARDRVGKKPLKYAELDGGGIVFASELKALLATGLVSAEPDLLAIHRFLSLSYVPAPGTGLSGVRKLPAGHLLVWEGGETRVERYWSLDFREKRERSAGEWEESVRSEVKAAVSRRMIADVPLGAFLSGGVDSSVVVACMAEASSGSVETFSIGFEHQQFNELPYARRISERYGTNHHEFVVRADEAKLLPVLARHYEEPFSDPAALPSYFLSRETRRHVTVALNGDGGDEGFSGYERYERAAAWERRSGWWMTLLSDAAGGASSFLSMLAPELGRRSDALSHLAHPELGVRYAWLMRMMSDRDKAGMYTAEMQKLATDSALAQVRHWVDEPVAGDDSYDRVALADMRGYLADQLNVKMDIASMAHALEARSPLLDHRVLELGASMPSALRCRGGALKGMLKSAFREAIDPDLLARPKQGFALPLDDWFRGPLLPLARDLLTSDQTRIGRYLESEGLRTLVKRHAEGRANKGMLLWGLSMLELWHREFVESGAR